MIFVYLLFSSSEISRVNFAGRGVFVDVGIDAGRHGLVAQFVAELHRRSNFGRIGRRAAVSGAARRPTAADTPLCTTCDTHSRHKTTFSPSIFNWFAAIDPLFIAATQICVCVSCQTIGLLDTAPISLNFYQYMEHTSKL